MNILANQLREGEFIRPRGKWETSRPNPLHSCLWLLSEVEVLPLA